MPSRGRGHEPATLGAFGYLTAVILCCLIVGYLTYTSGRQDERRDETPAAYSQAAKEDARRACLGIEGSAAFECIYAKVESSQEQAHNEQDLDAQQRAAFAALVSVIVAFLAFVATVAGVWFVKRTLDATLKAVEDTGEATKAMVRQNEISALSLDALYRPRVHIRAYGPLVQGEDIRQFQEGDAGPRVIGLSARVVLENAGKEPIVILQDGVWADIKTGAPQRNPRNDFIKPEGKILLGWGFNQPEIAEIFERAFVGQYVLTPDNRDNLLGGFPVFGRVVYRNVLDEIYEHFFAFKPIGIWADAEWQIWGGDKFNFRRKLDKFVGKSMHGL